MLSIRLSTSADRDAILSFIQRMGFNPRDAITWDGLGMSAMTAWMDERLIGVIPLEPRMLQIADRVIRSVHETVVAVDPQHRNGGIGSRMQEAIAQQRPCDAQIVTVFREELNSPAYRWYLKNKFTKAMEIVSWMCEEPATIAGGGSVRMWKAEDASVPWEEIEKARIDVGLVDRASRPLRTWLAVHPYRQQYAFHIVSDGSSFALLGVGTMHSQTMRAEVLEMTANANTAASLLRAVATVAMQQKWKPIRLPLATNDPNAGVARSLGFEAGWRFDMLVRSLVSYPDLKVRLEGMRYAGIDYI